MSDRASWTQRHQGRIGHAPPSPFVLDGLSALGVPPDAGAALDVACGGGRHTLLLARTGFAVLGVDWALPALRALQDEARRERLPVACLAADVSTWAPPTNRYALVLSTNFLERACLVHMRDAVAPGGALLLETFMDGQQQHGHPTNPDYLLHAGELAALCRGWNVLLAHEGLVTRGTTTAMMAGILAQRPR